MKAATDLDVYIMVKMLLYDVVVADLNWL